MTTREELKAAMVKATIRYLEALKRCTAPPEDSTNVAAQVEQLAQAVANAKELVEAAEASHQATEAFAAMD